MRKKKSSITNRESSLRKQGGRISERNVSVCRRWKLLAATLQLVWTVQETGSQVVVFVSKVMKMM